MVSPFACVAGSFNDPEEQEIEEFISSPVATPKKQSKKSIRESKNPYADRGLDKFSALLAELENKKQKIYTQKGSEDISFVRFVYSNSNDWKPIVVKSKDRKHDLHNQQQNHPVTSSSPAVGSQNVKEKQHKTQNPEGALNDKHGSEVSSEQRKAQAPAEKSGIFKRIAFLELKNLKHPRYTLAIAMLFILVLLTVYGRTFAILCTSVGWYLVPLITDRSSSSSTSSSSNGAEKSKSNKKQKEYWRKLSDKNMMDHKSSPPRSPMSSSPKSVLTDPAEKPAGRHTQRKSF